MPMDIKKYPTNWREVSRFIRFERAGNRCEWEGCGVRNGSLVATFPVTRYREKEIRREIDKSLESMTEAALHGARLATIVLTTAHVCDCEPLCSNPEHLKAWCQKHHLAYDHPKHMVNSRATRRRKARSNQQLLISDAD